ncbi:aminotransferase class I/II-fold pyridoxal phosphate-dependent enzyme [Spirochaetota bacterium]
MNEMCNDGELTPGVSDNVRPSSICPWIGPPRAYVPRKADPRIRWFLDANEGRALAAVTEALTVALSQSSGRVNRYPSFQELEAAIALTWNIDPGRVVVTAGGDDAIGRICAARLAPGASILVHEPAFEMFGVYARSRGASVLGLPWLDGEAFPLAETIAAIEGDEAIGLATLVSPSNPGGGVARQGEARAVADACTRSGVAFLFDAAYGEFADVDPSQVLVDSCSAYVVRSFSKAYGLAGMRLGYALAPSTETASALRSCGMPYPSSTLASIAALAALSDKAGLAEAVRLTQEERAMLTGRFRELGARVADSGANFVLARVADPAGLASCLARDGIAIRTYGGHKLLGDAVRVSCPGDAEGLAIVLEALGRAREYIR